METLKCYYSEGKNEHVRVKACLSKQQPAKDPDDRTQVLIRADRKLAN